MTFRGHGPARLITVSISMASRIIRRLPRYGRINCRISLIISWPPIPGV
jgi:hypothetical protein